MEIYTEYSPTNIKYVRQLTNKGREPRKESIKQFMNDSMVKINSLILQRVKEGYDSAYIEDFRCLKDFQYEGMGKILDDYRHAGYKIDMDDDNCYSLHDCVFEIRW